ncbi:hypothetical protein MYSTI_00589 [Myxococcus stipitatus DSM 14675]|uniref:Tetratricopeptide repeat protein n=1 Tax=Myxococcus stipitatus (strain DSM 14675 / JCM 12634 / Mx s8) TaxID=1278073 RepID=L7U677_MYXSD|nr:hypothetical protein [Myxococcus stipitatus]AGC41939.1 hypothetical protein MYSTI_00589 [Myxococcus stipitatus DSM 14675]
MGAAWLLVALAASPLDGARSAYQSGELTQARTELESLLYPLKLEGESLEAEGHLLLAATYHAQEENARAEDEVVRAFAVREDLGVDPLLYPPDFLAFVGRARTQHQSRIAELRAERRPRLVPPPAPLVEPVSKDAEVPTLSRAWYLAPLGIGHFKQGRSRMGTVMAVTQGVGLAVAGASLGASLSMRGADGRYSASDAGTARTLNVTYLVGAYVFAAAYAYGVLDGMVLAPEPPARSGP